MEIITQWPGHAAEDRSVSLYGLSDVTLTFVDGTDNYFARQRVFERVPDVALPSGVSAGVSPLFSRSELVYRYVLQSPDRSARDLHILQDRVITRAYKVVPGVADLSSLGGETMQYQVLIDPAKLAGAGLSVPVGVRRRTSRKASGCSTLSSGSSHSIGRRRSRSATCSSGRLTTAGAVA